MIREYAETQECRGQFLLGYLGEQLNEPCGHCDNCHAGVASQEESETSYSAQARVRHTEWGEGIVLRTSPDRLVVHFEEVGFKTLSVPAVEERDLLAEQSADPD